MQTYLEFCQAFCNIAYKAKALNAMFHKACLSVLDLITTKAYRDFMYSFSDAKYMKHLLRKIYEYVPYNRSSHLIKLTNQCVLENIYEHKTDHDFVVCFKLFTRCSENQKSIEVNIKKILEHMNISSSMSRKDMTTLQALQGVT